MNFLQKVLHPEDIFEFVSNEIEKIKICENQKPFIEIVDKILAITKSDDYLTDSTKQAKVKDYENQIDQMVYELYDLTPEEIENVKEAIKNE